MELSKAKVAMSNAVLQLEESNELFSVAADGFNRATFHGFLALGFFIRSGRLFENVGITAVVVTREIARCRLAAQVAIDALVIDVVFSSDVFRVFVCDVSHKILC